jgi:hypothetical protein
MNMRIQRHLWLALAFAVGCADDPSSSIPEAQRTSSAAEVIQASDQTRDTTGIAYYDVAATGLVTARKVDGTVFGTIEGKGDRHGGSVILTVGRQRDRLEYTVDANESRIVVKGRANGRPFAVTVLDQERASSEGEFVLSREGQQLMKAFAADLTVFLKPHRVAEVAMCCLSFMGAGIGAGLIATGNLGAASLVLAGMKGIYDFCE